MSEDPKETDPALAEAQRLRDQAKFVELVNMLLGAIFSYMHSLANAPEASRQAAASTREIIAVSAERAELMLRGIFEDLSQQALMIEMSGIQEERRHVLSGKATALVEARIVPTAFALLCIAFESLHDIRPDAIETLTKMVTSFEPLVQLGVWPSMLRIITACIAGSDPARRFGILATLAEEAGWENLAALAASLRNRGAGPTSDKT